LPPLVLIYVGSKVNGLGCRRFVRSHLLAAEVIGEDRVT